MFSRLKSVMIVVSLITTLCQTSVHGQSQFETMAKASPIKNLPAAPATGRTASTSKLERQSNEKLKHDLATLLSDAKAGKIAPPVRPQIQPPKGHNLSKKTKIAIVAGVALVVTAIIVYKKIKDDWFECKSRCVL